MEETWVNIKLASPFYFVSDLGRIKIEKPNQVIIKNGFLMKNGYLGVSIDNHQRYVHEIVLSTFKDRPDWTQCVNHINGIKTDNRLSNLEWTTIKGNNEHSFRIGMHSGVGGSHWSAIDISLVHKIYELKKNGKQVRDIKKIITELNRETIKDIFSGKNWRYEYKKFFNDSYKKTGLARGENCYNSKSKEMVLVVYRLKKEGKSVADISRATSLKYGTVSALYHGKNWKHLYKEHFG